MVRSVLGRRFALAATLVLVVALALASATGVSAKGRPRTPAVPNATTATVAIKVVNYYGSVPLPDTRVTLYNDESGFTYTERTAADGVATFTGIPYGTHRALISKPGFRDSVRIVIVDQPDCSFTLVHYPVSAF